MHRSTPYNCYNKKMGSRATTQSSFLWHGCYSTVHPNKLDQTNADAYIANQRYLGVFDGVGSMPVPSSMSVELALKVQGELGYRLDGNAQRFDRDTQLAIKSSVPCNVPGSVVDVFQHVFRFL